MTSGSRNSTDAMSAQCASRRQVGRSCPPEWSELPWSLGVLAAHVRAVSVEIVVYAMQTEADNFDGRGRPVAAQWERRVIAWPEFARRVQLCADRAAQAERIVTVARGYAQPEGMLGVGVADAEVLSLVENALARAGIAAFNPEGRSRARDGLYALLAWLRARGGGAGTFSAAKLWQELDALRAKHLPPTLNAARAYAAGYPTLAVALAALSELRATLTTETFPENVATALGLIFAERQIDAGSAVAESALASTELLRETGRALAAWGGAELTSAEKWTVARGAFAADVRTTDRPAGALDLLGWLELLWEDAPHLIVAGANDGHVPDAIMGDVFLPEVRRAKLGLKTNAERFARDAYLLAALGAGRSGQGGRIEVLVENLEGRRPVAALAVAFAWRGRRTARAGGAVVSWCGADAAESGVDPRLAVAASAARRAVGCLIGAWWPGSRHCQQPQWRVQWFSRASGGGCRCESRGLVNGKDRD